MPWDRNASGDTITFGRYRGKRLQDVPDDYIQWLIDDSKKRIERYELELERREMMEAAEMSEAERIVKAGFRALSLSRHPDRGGDPADFRKLAAAKAQLEAILTEMKKGM